MADHTEDALARLRAGLAEDERLAREALSPETRSGMVEKEEHDFRQHPRRTVRQVDATRTVAAMLEGLLAAESESAYARSIARDALSLLADIYREPTDAEGGSL